MYSSWVRSCPRRYRCLRRRWRLPPTKPAHPRPPSGITSGLPCAYPPPYCSEGASAGQRMGADGNKEGGENPSARTVMRVLLYGGGSGITHGDAQLVV